MKRHFTFSLISALAIIYTPVFTPYGYSQGTATNYYTTPSTGISTNYYTTPSTGISTNYYTPPVSAENQTIPTTPGAPPVIYQNSPTVPTLTNPSASLPGTPVAPTLGLPGQPSTTPATMPGIPSQPTPTLLEQLYPQPAQPGISQPIATQGQPIAPTTSPGPSLQLRGVPFETISPPDSYLPGIATIKDKKWTVSDFLYNLTSNIGVQVEVIKPEGKYVPISDALLEKRINSIFQEANINTAPAMVDCEPPLPMFYVLVMAYPCDKRCVGFVSAQLFEEAKPTRIDVDLNGIWQTITWERQALVASSCDDFAQEVGETIDEIASTFAERFKYYHPVEERKCFPQATRNNPRRLGKY